MIKINLLPVRARKKKENIKQQLLMYVVCVAAIAGVCGFLYAKNTSKIEDLSGRIKKVENEINKHRKLQRKIKDLLAQEAEVKKKLEIIRNLKSKRGRLVHMLDELSNKTPAKKVWFDSLTESGNNITIKGYALNHLVIADFMVKLAESPWIAKESVNLLVTKQDRRGGVKLRNFTITCRLTIPKEPEKK